MSADPRNPRQAIVDVLDVLYDSNGDPTAVAIVAGLLYIGDQIGRVAKCLESPISVRTYGR